MKTNAIVRILIWSLVILILSAVLVFFLVVRFGWISDIHHISSNQDSTVVSAIRETPDSPSADSDVSAAGYPPDVTPIRISAEEVRKISINWALGDITVRQAEGIDRILFYEENAQADRPMNLTHKNGKLEIDYSDKHFSGFGIGVSHSKDLTICLPMEFVLDELEIDTASSDLELQDVTIRKFDLDGADGSCNFANCQISDLDIDTASGDVTFSGSLDSLDFDAASADFTADLTNTPREIEMDSMSGHLDLGLPEDCGYSINMDGLSSSFHSDFGNTPIYGDGRCRIEVDGLNCNVTIRRLSPTP